MINRLAWDSVCFGYEVGMVTVEGCLDWQKFIEESGVYQLVYIFSKNELDSLPLSIKKVDEKITLTTSATSYKETSYKRGNVLAGQLVKVGSLKNGMLKTQGQNFENEFLNLALISGEYSRFKADDRLSNGEYEKLYYAWAKRALRGDDDGFVFYSEDKINGLITLASNENGSFKVGMLAVLKEYQEQGVGSLLIDFACRKARESAGQEVQVTTQKANKKALNFYLKRGFIVLDEQNVYHWWKG